MKKMVQMMLVAGAVTAFATAAKAQCNLTVSDMNAKAISTSPSGAVYNVSVRVSNNGTADMPATLLKPYIALYVNPGAAPGCSAAGWDQRLLMPRIRRGTSQWFTFRRYFANGSYTLLAFADYTCVVGERRENDNQRGMALVVP